LPISKSLHSQPEQLPATLTTNASSLPGALAIEYSRGLSCGSLSGRTLMVSPACHSTCCVANCNRYSPGLVLSGLRWLRCTRVALFHWLAAGCVLALRLKRWLTAACHCCKSC